MVLKFKDIDGWKPTSISIVDKPSHPLAVFEVYEDDNEFIKKYVQKEELNLSDKEIIKNDEETVTMSSSFFERVFGGLISKSEPEPEPVVKKEEPVDTIEDVLKRIDTFDERFSNVENTVTELKEKIEKLEKEEEPEDKKIGDPASKDDDEPLKDMVKKSKGVDPDLNQSSAPEESLMSRIGRSEDGMKWNI